MVPRRLNAGFPTLIVVESGYFQTLRSGDGCPSDRGNDVLDRWGWANGGFRLGRCLPTAALGPVPSPRISRQIPHDHAAASPIRQAAA